MDDPFGLHCLDCLEGFKGLACLRSLDGLDRAGRSRDFDFPSIENNRL